MKLPGEDVLPGESLAGDAVGEGLGVLVAGLAQVPHEQAGVRPETLLRLALKKMITIQSLEISSIATFS